MGKIYGSNGMIYIGNSEGISIKNSKIEWKPDSQLIDHTVFGDSKTYEIPFLMDKKITFEGTFSAFRLPIFKKPYIKVPDGLYNPHDLGLKLIGVEKISVGSCGKSYHEENTVKSGGGILGHAHKEGDGYVCIYDGRYILSGRGKADEALLHEQAHILAGPSTLHNEQWREIARRLGVNDPSPSLSYVYIDDEPEIKGFGEYFAPYISSL